MLPDMQTITPSPVGEIDYPDCDGLPMSDNTKQFYWIVLIKENLEILFAAALDVFIAGDLLWYPIEGDNKTRQAPDAMVAIGRPKGHRGSYKQWVEGNIPPQVVFEVLSPGNRPSGMARKLLFYERFGVEEYYIYDPDRHRLTGYQRRANHLAEMPTVNHWVSPRLGIRFVMQPDTLEIFTPQGDKFLSPVEIDQQRRQAQQQLNQEQVRVKQEQARVKQEQARVKQEQARADRAESAQIQAIAKLHTLGLTPEQIATSLDLTLAIVEQHLDG
jgi:Uma2 family endonuclease